MEQGLTFRVGATISRFSRPFFFISPYCEVFLSLLHWFLGFSHQNTIQNARIWSSLDMCEAPAADKRKTTKTRRKNAKSIVQQSGPQPKIGQIVALAEHCATSAPWPKSANWTFIGQKRRSVGRNSAIVDWMTERGSHQRTRTEDSVRFGNKCAGILSTWHHPFPWISIWICCWHSI